MTVNLIGDISFYDMNIYFIVFAFLGWVAEVAFHAIKTGKFINRGFLNGPLCPIYGVGVAVLVLFLNPLKEHWYLLFGAGVVFCTLLELITGFVLEKVFKLKWWDYSKEKFNFKGYICLKYSILWGCAVVLMFSTFIPLTEIVLTIIPYGLTGKIILISFWVIFIVDFIAVVKQLVNLKRNLVEQDKIAELIKSGSDKIGQSVSDTTLKVVNKLNTLKQKLQKSRLFKAFPSLNKDKELLNKDKEKK